MIAEFIGAISVDSGHRGVDVLEFAIVVVNRNVFHALRNCEAKNMFIVWQNVVGHISIQPLLKIEQWVVDWRVFKLIPTS